MALKSKIELNQESRKRMHGNDLRASDQFFKLLFDTPLGSKTYPLTNVLACSVNNFKKFPYLMAVH